MNLLDTEYGSPNEDAALTYQNHILGGVSRTFALTIPVLPDRLRQAVGNAYLLCRIVDTIEDDTRLTHSHKQQLTETFLGLLVNQDSGENFAESLLAVLNTNTPAPEQNLLRNIPKVLQVTRRLNPEQQAAIYRCLSIMTKGMMHFQQQDLQSGLRDQNELNQYCYAVAGVVGELLTDLFCEYSPTIASRRQQLYRLASSAGQGLQMTNILKDFWEDAARGMCWLPRDAFERYQVDLRAEASSLQSEGFARAYLEQIAIAHGHLRNAIAYTLLLPNHELGIRKFCLWAFLMALTTLRKIKATPHFTAGEQVKISRTSVRSIVILSNLIAKYDAMIKSVGWSLGRGLPLESQHLSLSPLDTHVSQSSN